MNHRKDGGPPRQGSRSDVGLLKPRRTNSWGKDTTIVYDPVKRQLFTECKEKNTSKTGSQSQLLISAPYIELQIPSIDPFFAIYIPDRGTDSDSDRKVYLAQINFMRLGARTNYHRLRGNISTLHVLGNALPL
jgi:hypothetical protein